MLRGVTVSRFKNYGLLGLAVLLVSGPARSQRPHRPMALPVLNVVVNATLQPSYSCGNNTSQGYGTTALFLSEYSRQQNTPELLFNGACGSEDYFDGNTAGDSMSLIADLGNVSLQDATAQKVFNWQNVHAWADYTPFTWVAKIVQGHTYAAVINQQDRRGLFVFTVTRFVPDQEVDLQYEVKDYQVASGPILRSPGFSWNQ